MIEVKGLSKRFGAVQVLTDINAVFEKGKVNQVIGKSGSGKSVLCKCIVGLFTPEQGQVLYDDATCDDGSAILPKGTKLTPTAIEKLRLCDCQLKPIYIVETRPEAAAAMT